MFIVTEYADCNSGPCSASVQKAELKVVGVLEVRTWGGAGVSVLVYTRGAAFVDSWNFGGVSVETTILHTFLFAPACNACTACTDMVYSNELERDVTTTAMAKAILCLKTLAFIPS